MTSAESHSHPPLPDKTGLRLHPPGWPRADESVRAALDRVYSSGDWGRYHGQECQAFSEELAAYHGVAHASLCSSGTIAVELALRGLGIGPGDEVLLAAYDFPGNFRAIESVGARPVLIDVNASDVNLDTSQVEDAMGPSTKAVIASHLHGGMIPMRKLRAIANRADLKVIEDACQCPGAWNQGKRAGTWGDIGVLSFGGSKLLTAGRGGAILTDDAAALQRTKVFRERGNEAFPLSELQAAVLRPQLEQLDADNDRRHKAAESLCRQLTAISSLQPLKTTASGAESVCTQGSSLAPASSPGTTSQRHQTGFYKLGMWYQQGDGKLDREAFSAAARAAGVALDTGFRGFAGRSERRCRKVGDLPQAHRAASELLILHHPVLLEPEQTLTAVIEALLSLGSGP
ncbi:MAG: aminotransferase class V-fold PLP-dependent enzyme [Pirellulales bacterium]|nr:aminotransferase class V-fold PLP-dependent enzyme [Pirellulales bacterium]